MLNKIFQLCTFKKTIAVPVEESSSTKVNNTWHYYNPKSDTTVIFVHGFLSNSESCWTSKSGKYWPDLVQNDLRFENPSIFLAGYHTAFDSEDYKLRDCAGELIRALERPHADGRPSPILSQNILFVCHSLGGIVTRYVLEAHTSKFSSKTIGLALMASPSLGSEYADTFSGIINFYRNGMANQLSSMNEILSDLDGRFKVLIDERRIPNLVGAEAIEHHFLYKLYLLPGPEPVVTKKSASRYFVSQVLPKTNHSSIVKPESVDDPSHQFLYDFFSGKFKSRVQKNKLTHVSKAGALSGEDTQQQDLSFSVNRILFDIYDSDCSKYYLERSVDEAVGSALSMYSVWLSGPSGCGKTSAIRHYLYEHGCRPIEVCLASCQGKLDMDSLVSEIASTAYQSYGADRISSKATFSDLTNFLAQHGKQSPIVLYLDEVPINSSDAEGITAFSTVIANLLDTIKHHNSKAGVRIVVSSIAVPTSAMGNPGKFAEHILPVRMSSWTRDELSRLLDKIFEYLSLEGFDDVERNNLLDAAKGSPRFLKMYLKNRFILPKKSSSLILRMTMDQYVA
jgi:pimeloyl-ACP methyl ester carboxylesterase